MTLAAYYPTKKALKEAKGQPLSYGETSFFGPEYKENGTFCVVGPNEHSRKWFAKVTMKSGKIEKVT